MSAPYETDERIKNYLDTHQVQRERMCLAILALDKRFSDVRPRHPRGGPDGGRDIEARFRKDLVVFGAVGFVNQATDSDDKAGGTAGGSGISIPKDLDGLTRRRNPQMTYGQRLAT